VAVLGERKLNNRIRLGQS